MVESVALIVDVATLRALFARQEMTLAALARAREGSGRMLAHRWRDAGIAMMDADGRPPSTAFLIAPGVLVTARHAVREELRGARAFADLRFVFRACWSGNRARVHGPVYAVDCAGGCRDPVLAAGVDGWSDFVVLRVTPIPGSGPSGPGIPVATEIRGGECVTAIGHPFGLPMCAAGVEPIEVCRDTRIAFVGLDAFSGNSGSPVLRVADQHVVGMLQSKSGWDFVAQGAHSIRLARDECADGEPARLVRMSAIMTALAEQIPVRNEVRDAEADTSRPLR